ncbi:PaaI family thioesterase [Aminivibrio sp.]|jgi:uncharacterized protein (TIGR00369 family)|uniref:PaaI family thioesterase n=1 Tax=Aminivibrio sp. TaxID=1872489 RepID=UPI001A41C513|nr:PaaI family thioesterase [Aminivibrio sp.]MBL3538156.1 PaaI family thioesterase [Aminivibrio sp.]MDK2959268.1 hypothetical protein [Synergistaceae bacterium]
MEKMPGSRGCFVCGSPEENRRSLGVEIYWNEEENRTEITIRPDITWCGYDGVVHGGIIASVFDDAMAWAVRKTIDSWAVTGEISVRYLRPVREGKEYVVEGRVGRLSGRKITTAARMADDSGKTVAEATALFIRIPGGGS